MFSILFINLSCDKAKNKLGVNDSGYRTKAVFKKRPQDPNDKRMEALYQIRPHRRITEKDMKEIFPEWNLYY